MYIYASYRSCPCLNFVSILFALFILLLFYIYLYLYIVFNVDIGFSSCIDLSVMNEYEDGLCLDVDFDLYFVISLLLLFIRFLCLCSDCPYT